MGLYCLSAQTRREIGTLTLFVLLKELLEIRDELMLFISELLSSVLTILMTGTGVFSLGLIVPDERSLVFDARNVLVSDFDLDRMAFIKDRDLDLDLRSLGGSMVASLPLGFLSEGGELGLLLEQIGGK